MQCNSVLYLVPEKDRAIAEIARILRPGGRLHLADVVVDREFPEKARRDVALWAGGIAGALAATEIVAALKQAGFRRVRIGMGFDCYAGTSHEGVARHARRLRREHLRDSPLSSTSTRRTDRRLCYTGVIRSLPSNAPADARPSA